MKIGLRVPEFEGLTLHEFGIVCEAYNEKEKEDAEWDLYNTREIIWYLAQWRTRPTSKEAIFPLEIDKKSKSARMKRIKEQQDYFEQQRKLKDGSNA
jgi:hypothetical protein